MTYGTGTDDTVGYVCSYEYLQSVVLMYKVEWVFQFLLVIKTKFSTVPCLGFLVVCLFIVC